MIYKNFNEIEIMTKNKYSKINKIFRNLCGYLKISHMAVIVITPEKNVFLASSSAEFTENFSKCGYHKYDNTLCPVMYENLDFYNWTEGYMKKHQNEIINFKTKYKLYNGSVFVRRISGFTILYTVATKVQDQIMKTLFINNSNSILEIGDYFYNELNNSFEEASQGLKMPKIEIFKPFLRDDISPVQEENLNRSKILNMIKNNISNYVKHKNETENGSAIKSNIIVFKNHIPNKSE